MSPDCPPEFGPRPRRPWRNMPEFTSLVGPAGAAAFRRTELSARIDFFLRTGFLLGAFFFTAFFFEVFFLGVVFLRAFFLVGIRKVYHYQILRTTHGFCQASYLESSRCSIDRAAEQGRVFQWSSASND